jgi:xanthine/uracil/vitamin C permease (AzgA family)
MVTVILTLLLVDVFDTAGTLVGVANRAGMLNEDGHLPRLRRALLSDSSATAIGAYSAPPRPRAISRAPPASRRADARGSPH